MEIALIILIILIFVLGFLFYKEKKSSANLQNQLNYLKTQIAKCEEKEKVLEKLQNDFDVLSLDKENLLKNISQIEKEKAVLETKLKENEKSFEEKLNLIKKSEEELKNSFNNLANQILESTQQKATKSIESLLNPLNSELKGFREKIENLSEKENLNINLLKKEIEDLKSLSIKLSDDAENLAKALKGEKKLQGNWGELVLERVLEMSGLRKGIEYEREVSLKNDENKTYRPDVIVHLPNNRDIIIDSKVSLNAYSEYVKNNNETDLKNHIKALKNHIDTLAEKKYENLNGVNSLDFVFMFVPIENALNLALENSDLFEYAFKKRVVLVSPSTLLVSLRAIEASWRYEKQAENIKEVVKSAENLYDKVRGFLEDFEKIGKSLDTAKETYEKAKNKLSTGRGNVIRQITILKEKAGINPKKEIEEKKWN